LPPAPIAYEARWAPEAVSTLWWRQETGSAGNHTHAVQSVAHPYANWSISTSLLGSIYGENLLRNLLVFVEMWLAAVM
jgi:hypothetical protein